jgi:hypothetical protein
MPKIALLFVIVATLPFGNSCSRQHRTTQDELVRRTQAIFDSVAIGDQGPWKKYFAEDCMYFDEKGRSMNKAALLADLSPMPAGYSGSIKIVRAHSHIERNVAVLSYDLAEQESVYGQNMTARYHGTDTWIQRHGEWQIVAGQMFRYYEDPAPGTPDLARYPQYAGIYQLAPGTTLTISVDSDQLYRQRGDRPKELLLQEAPDVFFRKGVEGRILFRRGQGGKVEAIIDRRNNEDIIWTRTR